jgi:hypothetical protein
MITFFVIHYFNGKATTPGRWKCNRIPRIGDGVRAILTKQSTSALLPLVYHLLSPKEPYSESVLARCDQQAKIPAEVRLRKQAASLAVRLGGHDLSGLQ